MVVFLVKSFCRVIGLLPHVASTRETVARTRTTCRPELLAIGTLCGMSSSHLERTAFEQRDESLHPVVVKSTQDINEGVRLVRLGIPKETSIGARLPKNGQT